MPFPVSLLLPTTFPHIERYHASADPITIRTTSRPVSSQFNNQSSHSERYTSKRTSEAFHDKAEPVAKDTIMEDYNIPIQPRKNSAYIHQVRSIDLDDLESFGTTSLWTSSHDSLPVGQCHEPSWRLFSTIN